MSRALRDEEIDEAFRQIDFAEASLRGRLVARTREHLRKALTVLKGKDAPERPRNGTDNHISGNRDTPPGR